MHKQGDEIHVDDVEATGARGDGRVRTILIVGTLLAIGLLTIIWMSGALSSDGVNPDVDATVDAPTVTEAQGADAVVAAPATDLLVDDADDIQAVDITE